jgi:hypothetical protein
LILAITEVRTVSLYQLIPKIHLPGLAETICQRGLPTSIYAAAMSSAILVCHRFCVLLAARKKYTA